MPLDASKFYLIRASNGWKISVRRGLGAPRIISGGARWDVIERPRRKSMVVWKGEDPWRMAVPVIFDGWIDDKNVEYDIRRTTQLLQSRGDRVPPYTFRIDGALPVSGGVWVMETIDWGDNVYWRRNRGSGVRMRQDATLNCLEYEPETVLTINKPPPMSVPYRVRAGDTLQSIAAAKNITLQSLKDSTGIRDGKKLKPGILIMIPPPIGGVTGAESPGRNPLFAGGPGP